MTCYIQVFIKTHYKRLGQIILKAFVCESFYLTRITLALVGEHKGDFNVRVAHDVQ